MRRALVPMLVATLLLLPASALGKQRVRIKDNFFSPLTDATLSTAPPCSPIHARYACWVHDSAPSTLTSTVLRAMS